MFPYFLKMCVSVLVPQLNGGALSHISVKFRNVKKMNSNGTPKKIFSQLILGYFRSQCTTLHESVITWVKSSFSLFPCLALFLLWNQWTWNFKVSLTYHLKFTCEFIQNFTEDISLIQWWFMELLLYTRHCTWHWWYEDELDINPTLK